MKTVSLCQQSNTDMGNDLLDAQYAADRVRAYRLALGEFVDVFSKAEMFLFFVVCHYSKTSIKVSRALFVDNRFAQMRDRLRRLHEIGNLSDDQWGDLKDTLDQFAVINERRNWILHHGAHNPESERAIVTNALLAHISSKINWFPISPEVLGDMSYDMRKIVVSLFNRHIGRRQWGSDVSYESVDALLRATWRYKPPPPSQNHRQRDRKKGHPRQPAPSPESNEPENGLEDAES